MFVESFIIFALWSTGNLCIDSTNNLDRGDNISRCSMLLIGGAFKIISIAYTLNFVELLINQ